ncbi:MAG: class I SAM-dependent methyltransferase [Verrucomicrobia bacterium]|nr:class I SAM-dependent methyltransferase [Verrucomicrobiota bacterium]
MVDYYAKRAAEHDRIYALPERQNDVRRLQQFCQTRFAGLEVLEISCGTGYWTQFIASSARSIVATDINEEVLAIARGRQSEGAQVEFSRADSYELPDLSRPFAAGFAGFWWSHVPKRRLDAFLAGFHRRLVPGALVAFIDNRYVPGSSTPISRTDESGDSFQLRKLGDGSVHEVLKNFPAPEELKAAIDYRATSVEITLLDYYWILTYRAK